MNILLFCSITKSHLHSNDSSSTQETQQDTTNNIDDYKRMLIDRSQQEGASACGSEETTILELKKDEVKPSESHEDTDKKQLNSKVSVKKQPKLKKVMTESKNCKPPQT